MSANLLPATATIAFESEVKLAYQGGSRIRSRGACRIKRGVRGARVKFPRIGRVRALPKVHRQDYVTSDPEYNRPEAIMSDWHASDLTDIFEDIKTNVDERAALARTLAMAIGRQEDQLMLDALVASDTASAPAQAASVAVDAGGWATDDTTIGLATPYGVVTKAVANLMDKEVPEDGDFFGLFPAHQYDHFAEDKRFISVDYGAMPGGANPARRGPRGLRTASGVELIFIGNRSETATSTDNLKAGGWPAGTGYIWEKNALCLAFGLNPRLRVEWIAMKGNWLTTMEFSAGAVVADPEGVVKVTGIPTA